VGTRAPLGLPAPRGRPEPEVRRLGHRGPYLCAYVRAPVFMSRLIAREAPLDIDFG
jgi:hypothetical protein